MADYPWTRRQQIPDPQVRDAADQFDDARQLLGSSPGVLPELNASAIAIELYLKSLGSETVFVPDPSLPSISQVFARPDRKAHDLLQLLDAIPSDIRADLEKRFVAARRTSGSRTLRDVLGQYQYLFVSSRYPFEPGADISRYQLSELGDICHFLRGFVAGLPPTERIHWKQSDGAA